MKKLIHIDNYESYYLDYLEGNLSDSERMALEEFLDTHPELRLEDEELIILDDAPELLSPLEKELLKKEEDRIVSAESLDYFAIGRIENALSGNENTQLNTYLSKHPEAQKTIQDYEATRLEAHAVPYDGKEELKHKEIAFVSWRLMAAVTSAAAILILFFQLGGNGTTGSENPAHTHTTVADNEHKKAPKNQSATEKTVTPEAIKEHYRITEEVPAMAQKNTPAIQPQKDSPKEQNKQIIPESEAPKNQLADNNKVQPHHPTILPEVKDNKQPVAPTLNDDVNKAPSKDLASNAGSSNMKNPIPIITNTISEKTNTPVDFKTGKATETEKGGFFLKIGKFEISHKSSKKK
ncbi:hypothetical protein, partial [Fluviicola sp.]|uniref:hypothetical protein n=1 Tax=Fluviicola sp. TaxID=1917219 RepID=UPI002619D1A2